jgi:ATP-dependent Lon protease
VLPIGGLKEKLLAALRGGIHTVIIPEENRKDLAEIPRNVTQGMKILPVRWIDEVLDIALERPLVPRSGPSSSSDASDTEAGAAKSDALRTH